MKFAIRLLAVSALFVPAVHAAEDTFLFKATVHGVAANAIPVEVSVGSRSVKVVELGNGLLLEFTSPGSRSDEERTMVRLLRREGEELRLLHTTQQGLIEGSPRENAYLVCGERLTFMSPPREDLPACKA